MKISSSPLLLAVASVVSVCTLKTQVHGAVVPATNDGGVRIRRAQEASPQPQVASVLKLRLMNADTDLPIPAYDPLPEDAIINLSTLSTKNLNIEAITEEGEVVRSLQWKIDGNVRTENNPRWALCGNSGSNFFACGSDVLRVDSRAPMTITATPFGGSNGSGASGRALTISLTLLSGITPPTKAPVAIVSPTKAPVIVPPPSKAPAVATPPTKAPAVVQPPTKAPVIVTPPTVSSLSFTLINADSDTEIGPLLSETVIDLAVTPKINIRANVGQRSIESVQFSTNGVVTRLDGRAPFSYFGNSGDDYFAWTPTAGRYMVSAAAYNQAGAAGPIVAVASVTFVVVQSQSPIAPSPIVRPPTRAPAPAPIAPVGVDVDPPRLLGLSYDPAVVDVTFGDATCVATVKVQDNQSGLKSATVAYLSDAAVTYTPPVNTGSNVVEFNVTLTLTDDYFNDDEIPDDDGSDDDDLNTQEFIIPIRLFDNADNEAYFSALDLSILGLPSSIQVTRSIQLVNFTGPARIDVTNGPVNVTFDVTTNSRGIRSCYLTPFGFFRAKPTLVVFDEAVRGLQTFPVTAQFPAFTPPLNYTFLLQLFDIDGTELFLDAEEFRQLSAGFTSQVEVTNSNVDDVPPQVDRLSVNPPQTTVNGPNVTIEMTIRDDQAGTENFVITVWHPDGGTYDLSGPINAPLVGVYNFATVLDLSDPFFARRANFTLSVFAFDHYYNNLRLNSTELIAQGLPGGFSVV